jgi:hypothetical protein
MMDMSDNGSRLGMQGLAPTELCKLGKERTDAMLTLQKDLLEAYEQASGAWLARVKSEAGLWSELATKLTNTGSLPEALSVYQESIAQRMQMAAEDGRKFAEEAQKIMKTIAGSLPDGWSANR